MTKFYENPARKHTQAQAQTYKPYVPQYRLRGLEPEDFTSPMEKKKFNTPNVPIMIKGTPDMFDNSKISIGRNIPFAEIPPTDSNAPRSNIPNIGNNIENTWAGLDGEIVDDLDLSDWNGTQHMIDNNDYVDIDNISTQPISVAPEEISAPISSNVELHDDQYLLAIDDTIITTGSLEVIEQAVRDLIFGDHELCGGKQIPADNIIVLKRLKIKVGVFVDG